MRVCNAIALLTVAGIVIVAIPIYTALDTKRHFYITLLFIDYFLFITTKFLSVANITVPCLFLFTFVNKPVYLWM